MVIEIIISGNRSCFHFSTQKLKLKSFIDYIRKLPPTSFYSLCGAAKEKRNAIATTKGDS